MSALEITRESVLFAEGFLMFLFLQHKVLQKTIGPPPTKKKMTPSEVATFMNDCKESQLRAKNVSTDSDAEEACEQILKDRAAGKDVFVQKQYREVRGATGGDHATYGFLFGIASAIPLGGTYALFDYLMYNDKKWYSQGNFVQQGLPAVVYSVMIILYMTVLSSLVGAETNAMQKGLHAFLFGLICSTTSSFMHEFYPTSS